MKRLFLSLAVVFMFLLATSPLPLAPVVYAYEVIPVSDGGGIKGQVTFKGALPSDAVEKITITKNTDVCGTGEREVVWIDVNGNALRGAFVFIEGIAKGKDWPKPKAGKYYIYQKGCRFAPWAEVLKPGPVTVVNQDKGVLHNINTREMIGVETGRPIKKVIFNFGQPEVGEIEKELKPRRSPYISINCEAHNFMFGFRMAPENPYAEVVGEQGNFFITDVPPGTYTVKAWHPRLGLKEGKVTVTPKGVSQINFEFSM